MRTLLLHCGAFLALAVPFLVRAQVAVDRPVVLTGPTSADRQVTGLAAPASAGDAMQAGALQRGDFHFGQVVGANWVIDLQPAPTTLLAGTRLTLLCQDGNTGPVTITVNGSAPLAVVKDGGAPLDAGDVKAGAIVELLYDGTAFQLTSGRGPTVRDCPSGFVGVNQRYCIQAVQHDTLRFDLAAQYCASLDARICSWGEWYTACAKAGTLGITDLIGDWEWTNDAGNADGYARMVGFGLCEQSAVRSVALSLPFRCCLRR